MSSYNLASFSHIGLKRRMNQDRIFEEIQEDKSLVMAVADGMGGIKGGEIAAGLCTSLLKKECLDRIFTPANVEGFALRAQKAVLDFTKSNPEFVDMGTTLTLALVKENMVFWTHVGDCRLYHFSGGKIKQITKDHRFLVELVEHGDISAEDALTHPFRHVLDQCIGLPGLEADYGELEIKKSDSLLLCSDGLHDALELEEIIEILNTPATPQEKNRLFLDKALEAGGKDNISAILVDYL